MICSKNKVKESGQTQQAVVIHAIAGLKIASAEEVEELKTLNQMFADILSQLRGATTKYQSDCKKMNGWFYAKRRYFVLSQ